MLQLSNGKETIVIDTRAEDPTSLLKYLTKKLVVGHNIKFDRQVIWLNYGIELEHCFDTMLAAQVLECGPRTAKGHFTLEGCTRRYVNPFAYSQQGDLFLPLVTKEIRKSFSTVTGQFTSEQVAYGAFDAQCTYAL